MLTRRWGHMARVDSILSIVLSQGANELRVGTDREPKMLAHGSPKRFNMPATDEVTLRELLGELLSPDREEALSERGRVDVGYVTESGIPFQVCLTARPSGGFDAQFVRSSAPRLSAPVAVREVAPAGERAPRSEPARDVAPTSWRPALEASPLVRRALDSGATDLHVADAQTPVIRVDGRLVPLDDEGLIDVAELLALGGEARASIAEGHSMEASVDIDAGRRARLHVYRASSGLAAAIRFFARTPSSLTSLNIPVDLEDLVDIPHGLVIVCGATGAGKSTTLAALAQEALRKRSIVLVTLEDPIEYALTPGRASIVRQRQVGRDVPTFSAGLRDAIREDPDVLVVGEMRDPETIALALTAAETGHLVFASLHSGGAASAIERIVDATPDARRSQVRTQLADALRVVVAQRLLPRARAAGRVPAVEVLRMTHAAASLVREGKTAQLANVMQAGRREGMIALERSLADRVVAGDVRREDAVAAANDAESLATLLQSAR